MLGLASGIVVKVSADDEEASPVADADTDGKGFGSAASSEHPASSRLNAIAAAAGPLVVRLCNTVAPLTSALPAGHSGHAGCNLSIFDPVVPPRDGECG